MWPGLGDIVSPDKIVSLDFLERVNLINKNYEQERGEKSSVQLFFHWALLRWLCLRPPHWFVCGDNVCLCCSGLFKVIQLGSFLLGSIAVLLNQLVRSGYVYLGLLRFDSGIAQLLFRFRLYPRGLLECFALNTLVRLCCLNCGYGCVLFYRNFLSVLFYRAAIGVVTTVCFIGLRFGLGDNFWLELFWLCFSSWARYGRITSILILDRFIGLLVILFYRALCGLCFQLTLPPHWYVSIALGLRAWAFGPCGQRDALSPELVGLWNSWRSLW